MAAVAAIEPVGHAQDGGEIAHHHTLLGSEALELLVPFPGRAAPVISGDGGDQLPLAIRIAGQIGVVQEIVAVLVVTVVRDERAHVVEHGRGVQERALFLAQPVQVGELIEQGKAEVRHLLGVLLAVGATASERSQTVEPGRPPES